MPPLQDGGVDKTDAQKHTDIHMYLTYLKYINLYHFLLSFKACETIVATQ